MVSCIELQRSLDEFQLRSPISTFYFPSGWVSPTYFHSTYLYFTGINCVYMGDNAVA
jgi:hypothetical protein